MNRRSFFRVVIGATPVLALAACGQPVTTTPTVAPAPTDAPAAPTAAQAPTDVPTAAADLTAIKAYLLDQSAVLITATGAVKTASDSYYELAKAANFDYTALWADKPEEVRKAILDARTAWMAASPGYERIEGIVAGVPSLSEYDVILDAGTSAAEGGDGVVPFDLTLPDGKILEKPGNLFGVTESALWGTEPTFRAGDADLDNDGAVGFGDTLPDANVLKGSVDALNSYATDLRASGEAWEPTEADAFTALVTMIPTMSEYFESWKNSRFVAGDASTQRDFVAISRLADIQGILGGLQIVHEGVSPLIQKVDSAQDEQIKTELADLIGFVAGVHKEEQGGKRFTPEEADTLGAEAQNRATAITGQITQLAAQLNITLAE